MGRKSVLPVMHETIIETSKALEKDSDGNYVLIETHQLKDIRINEIIETSKIETDEKFRIASKEEEYDMEFIIEDMSGAPLTVRFVKISPK